MFFTLSKDTEINGDVLKHLINRHQVEIVPTVKECIDMYEGRYEILYQEEKPNNKPDYRLVVNFANYLVDSFNGFFIGNAIKVSHNDEEIDAAVTDFRMRNDIEDNEAELSKICSICGQAYEYLWQDENAQTRATYNSPLDMFVVYDDTVAQEPLFGVRYRFEQDQNLGGTALRGEIRTATYTQQFETDSSGDLYFPEEGRTEEFYGGVPIIEYIENEERQSLIEPVKTLINGFNQVISEKTNDVAYFSDAYMKILGAKLKDEDLAQLKSHRIINMAGDGADKIIVEFLQKPDADQTQENLLDRLQYLIFLTSMVANITDEDYGNASGVALEFKLQPMRNMAKNKQRKFVAALRKRYEMVFNIPTNGILPTQRDEWSGLRFEFTENLPNNLNEEVERASKLASLVSKETALGQLSFVDNPKEEIQRMDEEDELRPEYDFLTNIGGVVYDEQLE